MTKPLTDAQRFILAHAATRDDGRIFPVPTTLNKNSGAVTLSLRPLVASGIVAEILADKTDTPWGNTPEGLPTTLVITPQGLAAIGVVSGSSTELEPSSASVRTIKSPAPSSKLGILIASLSKPDGATLEDLVAATGWQKHSVRGAISGALKVKHKLNVRSEVVEGKGRVYRVVNHTVTGTSGADADSASTNQAAVNP